MNILKLILLYDCDMDEGKPINMVRGGSVCEFNYGKGAHILMGSNYPGACMPSVGKDPRPRWRNLQSYEETIHKINRHSTAWAQRRGTRKTRRGLEQNNY